MRGPNQPSGLARIVLVFGADADPLGWFAVEQLLPLAGGGSGGHRSLADALQTLESHGLLEVAHVNGRTVFQRTVEGLACAREVIADDSTNLQEVLAQTALGAFVPEPGAPTTLDEVIGQEAAKHMVRTNLEWAARTVRVPATMLLYGPSGSGKTLIAGLVSRELNLPFIHLTLADVGRAELAIALDSARGGAVVFFDELQAGSRNIRDALLLTLDPSRPRNYVAVGATTDPGALSPPLRRRFTLEIPLVEYTVNEAQQLVLQRAAGMGLEMEENVAYTIARAARSNPARIARLLTEGAMLVEGKGDRISLDEIIDHLARTNRDERGVDSVEVEMMLFLRDQCEGAAGVSKFIDALGLDGVFIRERLHQLRKEGLLRNRGRAGHELTPAGRAYLVRRGY